MESIAYHLRQDGKVFPITGHIYCSEDGTLKGEASAAEFILVTKSEGELLAEQVLDTWIGIMIINQYPMAPDSLDVDRFIFPAIRNIQDLMEYKLTDAEILSIHSKCANYTTIRELKEYLNIIDVDVLQMDMMTLLNQQFCRVRYGGIYDSHGDPELWFRISSVGISWTDTIYTFVSRFIHQYPVECITICRDRETPSKSYGKLVAIDEDVKVYKADDGVLYLHMPIDEYLSEVHCTRDIFTTTDIKSIYNNYYYQYIWEQLKSGGMLHMILDDLYDQGIVLNASDVWDTLSMIEVQQCE